MRFFRKSIKKLWYKIVDCFVNCYQLIKYKLFYSKKNTSGIQDNHLPNNKKIIVSITSIPSRYSKLYLTLQTVMEQTLKPDKIILYLGKDNEHTELPKELKKMLKRGLTIKYVEDKNLKPHTKYFYCMQEYPDDIIITFDDDILYNKNIVKMLYESYLRYPTAISCIRAHKITFTDGKKIEKYNKWKIEYNGEDSLIPNHFLCATGVGGVLYPPHCMIKETFNIENIQKLSLNTDDLWLKVMEIKGNIKVTKATKKNYHFCVIKDTQKIALSKSNVEECKNDDSMQKLIDYYNIEYKNFE